MSVVVLYSSIYLLVVAELPLKLGPINFAQRATQSDNNSSCTDIDKSHCYTYKYTQVIYHCQPGHWGARLCLPEIGAHGHSEPIVVAVVMLSGRATRGSVVVTMIGLSTTLAQHEQLNARQK